jgi:hypothetical protein
MPTIKPPQYTKVAHPTTKVIEPCYTFPIEFTNSDDSITFVAEEEKDLSLEAFLSRLHEHTEWWNQIIQTFLQATSKLFSKPYTISHIHKIAKHALQGTAPSQFPVYVTLQPVIFQIRGGTFWVHWKYETETMQIDIPDPVEVHHTIPLPVLDNVIDGVEEVNLEDLPVEKNATEVPLSLEPPTKFYDKHRVKEARLKAKLAVYRAQHQMTRYYEKYGTELSDSDTETDSEESEEEVQL